MGQFQAFRGQIAADGQQAIGVVQSLFRVREPECALV
jgi:hypothetical protein